MRSEPPSRPQSAHLQRLSIAAAEELRKTVRSTLKELFGNFMPQFIAAVKHAADKALNPTEAQGFQVLTRALNDRRELWIESFVQHIDAHLTGGTLPQRQARGGQTTTNDDSIAVANIELRAEARFHKLVTELDARVNRLRLMLYVPIYTKALAPAGLCRALQDTADELQWPGRNRALLFTKFDEFFIAGLEEGLYRSLIAALTRIGIETAKSAADQDELKVQAAPPRQRKPATSMQAPEDMTHMDSETVSMLQSYALKSDGEGYTDGLLAADLLALAEQRPLPGMAQGQSWIPLQRIALAGHFLNEAIGDTIVPDSMLPEHESMRYPLMKSALTDETLFTAAAAHPLANMINEMLLKSATSRVTGNAETRRIADLLQQVLVQFNLSPEFVRLSMQNAEPIQETQVQRFFELQRQQAQQRRDFVISEARRVVANQLERLTFGRDTPAPAITFLNVAWGPLLTKRLLQHGAGHPLWHAGVTLMEQLLDELDMREPEEVKTTEWQDLTNAMIKALIAEGLSQEKLKIALGSLELSRKTPRNSL
ncbi:DUF1631 family protein [Stenotrophobium rhamnosiphilum]|uniref:DUF1631 domain-containing protein n=1 Tax=Stenotrophobium rhamnosiphilum TaxID=2029166 RepID=A0A2T5MK86_9GAMM|nr:DUF1631 family protein [Stenotrophobium rhamnosiphilum]PTU32980.1 hypothetical protein CJD38_02375 [Stenotrophobium rhamnosiphilum]